MSGHTPAPWTVMPEEDGCDDMTLVSCERCGIAMVYRGPVEEGFVGVKAGKANARLIAAAPELLNALKDLVRHDRIEDERDHLPTCLEREQAEDVIAKAEGRE